eukprot:370651-Heterocapsa_arctica.AAC.1
MSHDGSGSSDEGREDGGEHPVRQPDRRVERVLELHRLVAELHGCPGDTDLAHDPGACCAGSHFPWGSGATVCLDCPPVNTADGEDLGSRREYFNEPG